jgi:hypothetical protein
MPEVIPGAAEAAKKTETKKEPIQEPQAKPTDGKISEPQKKRFYAKAKAAGKSDDEIKAYLAETFKIEHTSDIPRDQYEAACEWADTREPGSEG